MTTIGATVLLATLLISVETTFAQVIIDSVVSPPEEPSPSAVCGDFALACMVCAV